MFSDADSECQRFLISPLCTCRTSQQLPKFKFYSEGKIRMTCLAFLGIILLLFIFCDAAPVHDENPVIPMNADAPMWQDVLQPISKSQLVSTYYANHPMPVGPTAVALASSQHLGRQPLSQSPTDIPGSLTYLTPHAGLHDNWSKFGVGDDFGLGQSKFTPVEY
jgi:hypothetical protein